MDAIDLYFAHIHDVALLSRHYKPSVVLWIPTEYSTVDILEWQDDPAVGSLDGLCRWISATARATLFTQTRFCQATTPTMKQLVGMPGEGWSSWVVALNFNQNSTFVDGLSWWTLEFSDREWSPSSGHLTYERGWETGAYSLKSQPSNHFVILQVALGFLLHWKRFYCRLPWLRSRTSWVFRRPSASGTRLGSLLTVMSLPSSAADPWNWSTDESPWWQPWASRLQVIIASH